jgi:hypothetical protein
LWSAQNLMADLLQVRFIEFRETGEFFRAIDRNLPSGEIPRRGTLFPLFPDNPPVKIVATCLQPNAESGAHWLVTYRRQRQTGNAA